MVTVSHCPVLLFRKFCRACSAHVNGFGNRAGWPIVEVSLLVSRPANTLCFSLKPESKVAMSRGKLLWMLSKWQGFRTSSEG